MELNKKRLHGYDPVFDRMDRKHLISYFQRLFPDVEEDSIRDMKRSDLIDALLDFEDEVWHSTLESPEDYPLRRPDGSSSAQELMEHDGRQIYWCWEKKPHVSALSLVTNIESYEWNLRKQVEQGTLILTAINTSPPLIVSLEIVEAVTDKATIVERVATFSNPISVLEVEQRLSSTLPRRSQRLKESIADQILHTISELVNDPAPIFLTAAECMPELSSPSHEALFAVALLQESHGTQISCGACGRYDPPVLEAHLSRPGTDTLLLEIQDHVDDVVLLCADCHVMAHSPSLEEVRNFSKPACPECGERNPRWILWGEPSIEPRDDVVFAGCCLPPGPLPRWECRKCEAQYMIEVYLGYQYYLERDFLAHGSGQ